MDQIPDFDLIILGGGIAGAGIARDAALRGARVLLLEKSLFGSGASSKSSRLIHGGIRYLELSWAAFRRGDWKEGWRNYRFVRSALKECRILESIAPDLIRPLPLVIPIYDTDPRHPFTVYFGAWVYSLLSLLSGGGHRPVIYHGAAAVLRVLPQLKPQGLRGAIQIWDRVTDDRALVLQTLNDARQHGATCLQNTVVSKCQKNPDGTFQITLGQNSSSPTNPARPESPALRPPVTTRALVNATGPWVDHVRTTLNIDETISQRIQTNPHPSEKLLRRFPPCDDVSLISPIAGAHITVPRFLPVSTILQAKDRRIFFCINIGDTCRIGTTERSADNPDRVEPTESEIHYLIESLAFYFPKENFSREKILSADAGIRPLHRPAKATSANAISREHAIVRDPSGLVNVVGVKLTDHRRAAEDVLNFLLPDLLKSNPKILKHSITSKTRLS